MTKQEYYNLLVQSALDGTFPGRGSFGCAYRTSEGKKCAVGILIPDELFNEEFNTRKVFYLPQTVMDKIMPEGFTLANLLAVQRAHDDHSLLWDAKEFIDAINNLDCFKDVKIAK